MEGEEAVELLHFSNSQKILKISRTHGTQTVRAENHANHRYL